MSAVLEMVLHVLVGLIWWVILLPILWLLATPCILILAIFSKQPYPRAVADSYSNVTEFWKEWGLVVIP